MATYQFYMTDRALAAYQALALPFVPALDFADPPQVGALINFGTPSPAPQWFVVVSKQYYFVAAGDTRVAYGLDTYTPPAGVAAATAI